MRSKELLHERALADSPRRRWLRSAACVCGAGWLGATGLTMAALPDAARAQAVTMAAPRVAVLDWGLSEVVLSLGVTPVAISRPTWYRALDGNPALPATVADTGLLYQPNFEVLQALALDLIIVTPWHAPLLPQLRRIARVETVAMFGPGQEGLTLARRATKRLGTLLNREAAAATLLAETDRVLFDARTAIQARAPTLAAVLFFKPIDATHVSVFGPNSLFGAVAERIGISNAWTGSGDLLGSEQVDLASLADASRVHDVDGLTAIEIDTPPPLAAALRASTLWHILPFVASDRVVQLRGAAYDGHPFAAFGGLRTAMRFAHALRTALESTPSALADESRSARMSGLSGTAQPIGRFGPSSDS